MSHEKTRRQQHSGGGGGRRGLAMLDKPKDSKGAFRRLLGYLRPHFTALIIVLVLAILSTAFRIVSPKIMGLATTKLMEGIGQRLQGDASAAIDFAYIGNILLALAGLYLFSAIFSFAQQYVMAGVAQRTVYDMRRQIKLKLSRLPLKYYDSRSHGEILSRVTNDVDLVSSTLQQSLTQVITAVVTLVGIITMMLLISPLLTVATLLILPAAFVITRKIASYSRIHFAGQQSHLGDLNGHVEEMFTGHKVVKAFGREPKAIAEFEEVNSRLYQSSWKAEFISGTIMPLMQFLNNLGFVIVSVAGGVMVTRGSLPIGDVQAMIQYARQFTQPISQTASIFNIFQSTMAAAERVFEVLDEDEVEEDNPDARELKDIQGEVKFEGVQFGYSEPLFEDLNIAVKPGQTVAIVGPTGAGKTTLVNLLMRFYDVQGGRIKVDGVDIMDMRRGDLRSIFGMVLQDTWLFNGSIRDNIAYGHLDASNEQVVAAAEAAHADHFIRTLPDGYDTILNEEGSNISQGQKQLLTIARAVLANPSILILDEATSSVDTRTELLIQRAMDRLMQGRTSFVIAHRLSTIRDADLILVMNEGSIIEQGNHQQLLDQDGFYADLYRSQFAGSRQTG